MSRMTVPEIVALQKRLGLTDHVVELDAEGFTMAHTDAEREAVASRSWQSLEDCELHNWLIDYGPPENVEPGLYTAVRRQHDPTSQSFRSGAGPYDFVPILDD